MKWYKIVKAFSGHKAGDVVELDPTNESVSLALDAGYIEDAPAAAEDAITKAVQALTTTLTPTLQAAAQQAAAGAVETVNKAVTSRGIPGRVEAGATEDDKRKSFGHFLQCVGVLGTASSDVSERETAFKLVTKMYGSSFNSNFDADWAKGAAGGAIEAGQVPGLVTKTALSSGSGTTGGYTVPPEYSTRLLEVDPETNVLVGLTDDYPLVGRELVMPALDQTTVPSAGSPAWFGGVVAKWTAEAAARSETEPAFKDVRLVANELSGYALASRNVLMDNVVALETRLTNLFRGAIGWYRDYAYLRGDGIGKPRGILSAGATKTVTRGTGSHITWADFVKMMTGMLPGSFAKSVWVMGPDSFAETLQIVDSGNHYLIQPYFNQAAGPAAVGPVQTILGRPIKITEKCPALGTSGDIMLIDPSMYFTATRQDVEIQASEHYRFINNQVTYRFLFRGDGRPWLDSVVTLQDGTRTLAPFAILS